MAYRFPKFVTLPTAPIIAHDHLRLALGGPSRQLLHKWRGERGFPKSWKEGRDTFTATDAVAAWCERNGATVRRL